MLVAVTPAVSLAPALGTLADELDELEHAAAISPTTHTVPSARSAGRRRRRTLCLIVPPLLAGLPGTSGQLVLRQSGGDLGRTNRLASRYHARATSRATGSGRPARQGGQRTLEPTLDA